MGKQLLLALAFFCLAVNAVSASKCSTKKVVCYHGTWSYYRAGNGKFAVSDVPANLCTHYIYTFVGLNNTEKNPVVLLDSWLDINLGGLKNATELKNQNPNLTVIVAIGGWNQGSERYSIMAENATLRATFIKNAVAFCKNYNFDGFDLDWEYPTRRDTKFGDADRENFGLLVKEMSEAFHAEGLVVSAAVSPLLVQQTYDVEVIAKYIDSIHVMTYDFRTAQENVTGLNAPLFEVASDIGTEFEDYNVNASILGWLASGVDPCKLVLGVPFYGRTYTLVNASDSALGSPTTATGGPAGQYTGEPGFLGYLEILELFATGNWTKVWLPDQKVPYAHDGTTWLSYDDPKSLTYKVDFAKQLGLAGISIWSIETDDRLGSFGETFPLLNSINNAVKGKKRRCNKKKRQTNHLIKLV